MKKLVALVIIASAFLACKDAKAPEAGDKNNPQEDLFASYTSVGEDINGEGVLSTSEMSDRFEDLEIGDTLSVKFKGKVNSVCKKKGCWMNLGLENGEEAVVKFKDYEFFVPKDIEDKEVVVNGKAYVTVVSVEEQRHLAEDGGKSPEEIAAITEPKKTLSFLADGVLIEQ